MIANKELNSVKQIGMKINLPNKSTLIHNYYVDTDIVSKCSNTLKVTCQWLTNTHLLFQNLEQSSEEEVGYSILDVLNADCLSHILSYIPIRDLIRSERVSKRWQSMIQEYLQGK